ncbi:hypothetical protein [Roseitalea porphyridii]|uniref:Uncharacterized protein n=1 Tax=Roseitalea porphyridii TaxID=1852022 RepID=A0A4P6UZK2_9HYPH|nr:hypothetical protein [Roseitalea porphyridii]QBK30482.1 hypothetical protein E0E05_07645 [Roseitalea porphyridii]
MVPRSPDRRRWRRSRLGRAWRSLRRARAGDVIVWSAALGLAALAVWFPWDVHLNEARYGPPTFQFSRGGEIPADVIALEDGRAPLFDMVAGTYAGDPPPREVPAEQPPNPFTSAAVPLDDGQADEEQEATPPGVDPITTASIPDGEAAARVYRLLDAGRGLALIADAEGIYIVRPGAMLPDGRRVTAVVGRGAAARIVAADRTEVRFD